MKKAARSLFAAGASAMLLIMSSFTVRADYSCDVCGRGTVHCWEEATAWLPTGQTRTCSHGYDYEVWRYVYYKEKCDYCGVEYLSYTKETDWWYNHHNP